MGGGEGDLTVRVLVWVTPGSWETCVDRARELTGDDADVTLLSVIDDDTMRLATAPAPGRLGRHRAPPQAEAIGGLAEDEARALLHDAARRLGRPAETIVGHGRVEHEVARACEHADLLVCAREGDDARGPKSLGRRARFVVDHAGCDVVLVWANGREHREQRPLPPPPAQRPSPTA